MTSNQEGTGAFMATLDHQIWQQIMQAADDGLKHELWVLVINEIAASVIEQDIYKQIAADDKQSSEDDLECIQQELIDSWLDDALPWDDHLADVLGELDYFRDISLAWYEIINLAGEACSYSTDVVRHLRDTLEYYPDAQDAITDGTVEQFYRSWRQRFLHNVLKAAILLNKPSVLSA